MSFPCFNTIPGDPAKSILLFGDPHSDFTPVIRTVVQHRPAAVVLLGDLTPVQPLHLALGRLTELTEVWFIHGNHDGDDELAWDAITTDIVGSELEHRNLHGKVATIAGLRVAGLGGVFRESIWYPRFDANAEAAFKTPEDLRRHMKPKDRWRGGISLKHRTSIFPSEAEALASRKADVLVTHEAPSWHDHGFVALDGLAERMGVRWIVHGHHHTDIDYQVGHQRLRKPTGCGINAYGVDQGSFIALPR